MCYSATHLEKLDGTREAQWQKVARLTPGDMACVTNLEYLGVPGAGVGAGGRVVGWVAGPMAWGSPVMNPCGGGHTVGRRLQPGVPGAATGSYGRLPARSHLPHLRAASVSLMCAAARLLTTAVRKRNKSGGITFGRKRRRAVRGPPACTCS